MSENDLDLKLACRRLAWVQGAATRLNVLLTTPVNQTFAPSKTQEYTDLDVMSISMGSNYQLDIQIFDCKNTAKRTTERMFWLAGVKELFDPRHAWMVRTEGITEAARSLSEELKLGTLDRDDLDAFSQFIGVDQFQFTKPVQRLFSKESIDGYRDAFKSQDSSFQLAREKILNDSWVKDPHLNMAQIPSSLGKIDRFNSKNPIHVAFLLECTWVYMYSLAHAVAYVANSGIFNLEERFKEFFFGGIRGYAQRSNLLHALESTSGVTDMRLLPDDFSIIFSLFSRYFVDPRRLIDGMRYVEVVSAGLVGRLRPPIRDAFGEDYDEVSAKLVCDVVHIIVHSAGLAPSFNDEVKSLFLPPASGQGAG